MTSPYASQLSDGAPRRRVVSAFRELRGTIAAFTALIGAALIFLGISRGSQLHQLAIGIVLASLTLALALILTEFLSQAGLAAAKRLGLKDEQ